MIPHCSFNLPLSNNEQYWVSFHMFINCLYELFGEMYLGLLPSFWLGCWIFCYWAAWAAYIFWRSILWQLFSLLLFNNVLLSLWLLLGWIWLQLHLYPGFRHCHQDLDRVSISQPDLEWPQPAAAWNRIWVSQPEIEVRLQQWEQ